MTATTNQLENVDYVEMLLRFILDVVISRLKMVINDRVGSFAIKADLAIGST
jgi:hypothetical protein